jgi:fused signal recognition particle receptor
VKNETPNETNESAKAIDSAVEAEVEPIKLGLWARFWVSVALFFKGIFGSLDKPAITDESSVEDTTITAAEVDTKSDSAFTAPEEIVIPTEIVVPVELPIVPLEVEPTAEESEASLLARLKQGLSRTNSNFSQGLGDLILGQKEIDEDLLEEIETQLLVADIGIDATTEIIDALTERVERKQLKDSAALYEALKKTLADLLIKVERPLCLPNKKPAVILVVGVNGVGKTTTIGKLAKRLQAEGKSVMLAAGDTFRAAAVEQLQVWGERNNIPVVAQHTGADSASVIYDAIESGQSKGVDVVIADTAGRLHNKGHLMEELTKVKRVMSKLDADAPHEVLLVLDAGTGQNALNQTEHFVKAVDVTGLVLTKLDGTAKGGIVFALSQRFGLPVRFIGVGEGINDLRTFSAADFVEALFDRV